jgi:hypothetical protein
MPENEGNKEGPPSDTDKTNAKGTGGVPLVTPPPASPAGQLDKGQREALRQRLRERFH